MFLAFVSTDGRQNAHLQYNVVVIAHIFAANKNDDHLCGFKVGRIGI